jgi:hypothetical protein
MSVRSILPNVSSTIVMARLARRNFDRLMLHEDHPIVPSSDRTEPTRFGRFSVKTRPTLPVDLSSFGLDNLSEGGEASLIKSEASQKSAGR